MPATLTTKCPECEGITGNCLDSTLDKDRTEYDGRQCIKCRKKAQGPKLGPRGDRWLSKKTGARWFSAIAGHVGIP